MIMSVHLLKNLFAEELGDIFRRNRMELAVDRDADAQLAFVHAEGAGQFNFIAEVMLCPIIVFAILLLVSKYATYFVIRNQSFDCF